MPVVEQTPDASATCPLWTRQSIVGVIEERSLLEKVFRRPEIVDAAVATVMDAPLPLVDADDDMETLFPLFTDGGNGAVVVRGRPAGRHHHAERSAGVRGASAHWQGRAVICLVKARANRGGRSKQRPYT